MGTISGLLDRVVEFGEVVEVDPANPDLKAMAEGGALVATDALDAALHGIVANAQALPEALALVGQRNARLVKVVELRARHAALLTEYTADIQALALPQAPNTARWPNHSTKKLEALRQAALKFWGPNYHAAEPDSAPRNETVIDWLQKEHAIGATPAAEMASILRPDNLRTGPR